MMGMSESDSSSLGSMELEGEGQGVGGGGLGPVYIDSDTGLESMSSAETPSKCGSCVEAASSELLRQEVTRLKCDKLDLLRQNVVSSSVIPGCVHYSTLKYNDGLILPNNLTNYQPYLEEKYFISKESYIQSNFQR